ncbi:MAG: cytosine permease [Rubrobacteraceae bacterium]|uniref:purine-cytosine permease family protein n=1 Tax=Rubrobacter naiadicus TaxID=1392641 RepID=UPI002361B0CA|nr:cytosine permease [Rubrobacter naiadicus]MBX6765434.1 cytosine permease [Rubrobacteraceae bacterium]MCL6439819.1 cytosine permease [Rubrobacteraceae bacterium]
MEERAGKIEVRSIDYVPQSERHGKVWYQGPFWFTGNFVLVTMVTGFIGPGMGLSLGWSVLAVLLGSCFGTFFMAFHANQGPRMGLPQMIQSRAQFGLRGAVFPFAAAVFVYIGFNVFDVILASQGLDTVLSLSRYVWYPLLIAVAVTIAIVGYDLLLLVQRWLTYVLIVVFGILTVYALVSLPLGSIGHGGGWSGTAFLVQFAAAAGYQISYAIYVSDYSRYLYEDVSAPGVISWTYAGAAGSAVWLMSLGAVFASSLPHPDAIASVQEVGNRLFPGFGTLAVVVGSVALVTIMAVNAYGAMLTGASGVDGFRPVRPTLRVRVIGIVVFSVVVLAVALAIPENYLNSFNNFVLLMLYFLVPWTAVNLVDFYFVRHGHYAITELFNHRNSIYHDWSWRGLIAYFAGLIAMVPFFNTTFYVGPVTKALGGADISFVVGLGVSGILYYALSRGLDLTRETSAAAESRKMLEESRT